jgi:hypothetical protein
MAFGVGFEVAAGGVERGVEAQAGEDVGGGAVRGGGVGDAAGGEEREAVGGGEVAEESDFAVFAAEAAALDLDEEAGVGGIGGGRGGGGEDGGEFGEGGGGGGGAGGVPGAADGAASSPVNAMSPSEKRASSDQVAKQGRLRSAGSTPGSRPTGAGPGARGWSLASVMSWQRF